MSKPIERVEIITGIHRRRRYTDEEKVRLVEQAMQPGMTVSAIARLHGVSPSLLFQWRRRMAEGGQQAVRADEAVVPISRVRELENRVRELERLLGRKIMETEILFRARPQSREQRRLRGFREDLQARLRPREPQARRHLRPAAPGRMVRRLQHHPPSQRLAHALAP